MLPAGSTYRAAPSGAAMQEAEKVESYGFDVLEDSARRADPVRAQVWFEVETVQITDERGRNVQGEPRVMMKMRSFADPQALFSVPKMPAHEQKYPRAWASFVRGVEDVPNGTAIDELPRVSRMTRELLRSMGVRTIEEAADLSEQVRQRLGMEGDRVREIARAWLKKEAGGEVADLATEVAAMRAQLEAAKEREAALAMEVAASRHAIAMVGTGKGGQGAQEAVTVEQNPNYDDMPYDALAGDGDDDGMDSLIGQP